MKRTSIHGQICEDNRLWIMLKLATDIISSLLAYMKKTVSNLGQAIANSLKQFSVLYAPILVTESHIVCT